MEMRAQRERDGVEDMGTSWAKFPAWLERNHPGMQRGREPAESKMNL